MKKTLSLLLILSAFISAKDKETHYIDHYTEPLNMKLMADSRIQEIQKTISTLPSQVDNSFSKHMRPVFNQVGGSCGSASRICYMFGYEINNHRNLEANNLRTQYPSHFTWLLTGQNSGKDEMAIFNGVPTALYYNGNTYSTKYGGQSVGWPNLEEAPDYGWMNGYNRWENALNNRLEKAVHIKLTTPENLEVLKSWIYNHNGDTTFQTGGVAGAGVASSGMVTATIPSGLYKSGKYIVKNWGPQVDHGTTWSGYDDSVGYDFNNDGLITNDIDITGDGKVNMRDWEIGALIMLNSWGSGWKNSGAVYVPYRLLLINNMSAEFYYIRKNYKPEKVMKIKMDYSKRCDLKLSIGISTDTSSTLPEKTETCHHFNYAGNGAVPMLGKWADGKMHDEPMEFCFDLTDLQYGLDVSQPYDLYLNALAKRFTNGSGTIYSVSIIDYLKSEDGDVEYFADLTDLPINGGDIHYIPIRIPGDEVEAPEFVYLPQSSINVHYYDSEDIGSGGHAANVLDGDTETIWHTSWQDTVTEYPHEIQFVLDQSYEIVAFEYLPRQVGENGRISQYEIYISDNDTVWGDPVATGTWMNGAEKQLVTFDLTEGNYVRLVALSEVNGNEWTSCSEINIMHKPAATTSIDEKPAIVSEYKLFQNYPNPFNPTTIIKFSLPKSDRVKLTIFDLLGREVTTLIDGHINSGTHEINYDASDLSSGIYFYRIQAGKYHKTSKMLLQK